MVAAADGGASPRRRVLRHPSQLAVACALGTAGLAALEYLAMAFFPSSLAAALVAAALAAAIVALELRVWIAVDDAGIEVRNRDGPVWLPWERIGAFTATTSGNRPPQALVVDAEGRAHPIDALTGTHIHTAAFRTWSASQLAWLESELERRAGAPEQPR